MLNNDIKAEKNPNIVSLSSGESFDLTGVRLAVEEVEAGADTMTREEMYNIYYKYHKGPQVSFERFCKGLP